MIEAELAAQWASVPRFPNQLTSWTWFKISVNECVARIAQRLELRCELHHGDLAVAFFQWASHADSNLEFSKLEPVDYAHYACGALLGRLVQAHPVSVTAKESSPGNINQHQRAQLIWPEDQVILRLTLTFLEAWRLHLGAAPLVIDTDLIWNHWASFHENAREDSSSSIPFLDMLLGLSPVWERPTSVSERPAMRSAHDRLDANPPRSP